MFPNFVKNFFYDSKIPQKFFIKFFPFLKLF